MKTQISIFLLLFLFGAISAQEHFKLGIGYYGENVFNSGLVLQAEKDMSLSSKLSFPVRLAGGYYIHKRNHQALFADLSGGLRYHFAKRYFTGLSLGIGVMSTWHDSDQGVYTVEDQGAIAQTSNFAGIDFMPSLAVELGFKMTPNEQNANYVWVRPKYFVQMNVNERALLHFAFELGYSFSISNKK
ncbi:MAG: hypothetical protein AAF242_13480 [Bacteroidota bacterium]